MTALLILLGILVCFNFSLKQTFLRLWVSLGVLGILSGIIFLLWPYAIEQSKTQIAQWVQSPRVMLNISVLITLDVVVQLFFCTRWARRVTEGKAPRMAWLTDALQYYPGFMIIPTGFAGLTWAIFSLPGMDFTLIASLFALGVFLLLTLLILLLRRGSGDTDTRLELLFLTSILEMLLGIVVTVNGATAVQAVSSVNWQSSLGVLGIILMGGLVGLLLRRAVKRKNRFA